MIVAAAAVAWFLHPPFLDPPCPKLFVNLSPAVIRSFHEKMVSAEAKHVKGRGCLLSV